MADEPEFLTLDDALEIHQDQIEHYGGDSGIRDLGLLSSALAQPSTTFGGSFLHEDLFAMAAAYLFHLVQNHPFVDGNKRVGAVAAYAFLDLNGVQLPAACEDDLVELTLATACGETDITHITDALRHMAGV